jgi:DNA adenine methylase
MPAHNQSLVSALEHEKRSNSASVSIEKARTVPFLRYPGGKQRILQYILPHLPKASDIKGLYVEPFAGAAAVFFSLNPRKAVLSDLNPELIALYRGIRKSPMKVWKAYEDFPGTKRGYYSVRARDNDDDVISKAARLLYLNRTCFKGMWRQNSHGKFTVGYGGQDRRWAINRENLCDVALRLRKATIICSDFESVVDYTGSGDFVFLDPPYRPGARDMVQSHYLGSKFKFSDQQRLAQTVNRATRRGVRWAMTNSSHPDIVRLFKGNVIIRLPRGTGPSPGVMTSNKGEVLIRNYNVV